jgi:hypothetical protein
MTNKAGTMHLQWASRDRRGRLGAAAGRQRRADRAQAGDARAAAARGQGGTRPLEAVPEMDRYMYDLHHGVSALYRGRARARSQCLSVLNKTET